jgi:hypothetical protein
MSRFFCGSIWIATLSLIVCLFPGAVAAVEPEASPPQNEGKLYLGGFEKSLPIAIGGGITVGILWAGFFLLNARQPESGKSSGQEYVTEQLPPDVVPAPNPLRYLAVPVLTLVLLAMALPLGYSIWTSLPDRYQLVTPPKQAPLFTPGPSIEAKFVPLPESSLKFSPSGPPIPICIQQLPPPPPIRVPVITPPNIPRR